MRLKIPITLLTLALAITTHHEWLKPVLWANSITGYIYHHIEKDALERYGIRVSGIGNIRMSGAGWSFSNVVGHVILPYFAYRSLNVKVDHPELYICTAAIIAYFFIDLNTVYPTSTMPFEVYIVVHAALLLVALQILRTCTPPPLFCGGCGLKRKRRNMTVAVKNDPKLWQEAKRRACYDAGMCKHSARAMQWATQWYKSRGGTYKGRKDPGNKLTVWTRQKWRTESGAPSADACDIFRTERGPRYPPTRDGAPMPPRRRERVREDSTFRSQKT